MNLTSKELAIIQGKADSLTVKEIAKKLNLSRSYAELMLHKLYEKTGTRNGPSLVSWAYQNGHLKISGEIIYPAKNKAG